MLKANQPGDVFSVIHLFVTGTASVLGEEASGMTGKKWLTEKGNINQESNAWKHRGKTKCTPKRKYVTFFEEEYLFSNFCSLHISKVWLGLLSFLFPPPIPKLFICSAPAHSAYKMYANQRTLSQVFYWQLAEQKRLRHPERFICLLQVGFILLRHHISCGYAQIWRVETPLSSNRAHLWWAIKISSSNSYIKP